MMCTCLIIDYIGLGLVFQSLFQHVLHIGDRTTLAGLSKFQGDEGIEAHTTGAEERKVVDDAVVERLNFCLIDNLDGLLDIHWQTEVPGKTVAAATGYNAQGRLSVNQRTGHLVHGAIASNGYTDVVALFNTFFCKF